LQFISRQQRDPAKQVRSQPAFTWGSAEVTRKRQYWKIKGCYSV